MSLIIEFKCNICPATYIPPEGNTKTPVGWGVMTPQLRIGLPRWASSGIDHKKWKKAHKLGVEFKLQLMGKRYHICPDCLELKRDDILQIEGSKKQK